MISSFRIASVGRDLGIQIYNHEMREWQEHSREKSGEKPSEISPADDFIRDALSIFDPPAKPGGG